jgi:hypothetical protein
MTFEIYPTILSRLRQICKTEAVETRRIVLTNEEVLHSFQRDI